VRRALVVALLLVLAWPGFAALRIHTSAGTPVRWFAADLPLRFVVQAAGSDDVPDASDDHAVRRAFADWAALPGVDLPLVEETDPAERARTDWAADDNRLVIFDEDGDPGLFPPGSGIVAVTPLQYLARMRMERAGQLLRESHRTVAAVGRAVGFDDPFYFSRAFGKHFGHSPSEHRAD